MASSKSVHLSWLWSCLDSLRCEMGDVCAQCGIDGGEEMRRAREHLAAVECEFAKLGKRLDKEAENAKDREAADA